MILLFKLTTITRILYHLFTRMLWFSLIRVFKDKAYQDRWLFAHVLHWGTLVSNVINLKCSTSNKDVMGSVDWERNVFLVANHQSYSDIPAIYVASQKVFGFIAKYELSWIPFLAYWMKLQGCVFIKRARYVSAIKRLKRLEKRGKACRLAIFPEGTRSKNGKLSPFKSGALKIAWQLDAILIPTVIQGTRPAWEERKTIFQNYPVKVKFNHVVDLREVKNDLTFKEFVQSFESHFHYLHEHANDNQLLPFEAVPVHNNFSR